MIDIRKTLLKTINSLFHKIRFLGLIDNYFLRKILSVIIIDYVLEWADYMDEKLSVLKALIKKRDLLIMSDCKFDMSYTPQSDYTNVNTAQTIHSWQRILDALDVTYADNNIVIADKTCDWQLDPDYKSHVIYFWRADKLEGEPEFDITKLTIHERMNIYINYADSATAYYLEPGNCTWKQLLLGMTEEKVNELIDNMQLGILVNGTSDGTMTLSLTRNSSDQAVIPVPTYEEILNLFNE